MSTRTREQAKKDSWPTPAPARSLLLQRKCACDGSSGGGCAGCGGRSLAPARRTPDRGESSPKVGPDPDRRKQSHETRTVRFSLGHSFGRLRVNPETERWPSSPAPARHGANALGDAAEWPLSEEVEPDVDLAQEPGAGGGAPPAPEPAPGPPTEAQGDVAEAPASCCAMESFVASDDSYVDTETESKKNIKFTFKVKSGGDEKKCVMVNWIQGTAKNKDGSFRKVKMFGAVVDYNFPTMRIDSLDADPVYWSDDTARWRYRSAGANSFYATDSPGPRTWVDGIDYDLKFKMCLYCIDDVATTSDAAGSGVKNPLKCIDWVFKAKYDGAAKTFTH